MKRRAAVTAALTPLGVLGVAGVAFAFWTATSSGAAGTAAAAALGVPSVSTSDVTTSNVTVNVTTAPTSGPAPTSYRVDRTAPGATIAGVCSVTGSTGSCADPSPVAGATNSYSVYGQIGTSWVASTPGVATASVPSSDSTAPVTTASAGQAPNAAGWNKADVTATLTASDTGSGVKDVTYSTTGSQVSGPTTVTGSSTSVVISTEGTTTISYFATDNANNIENTKTLVINLDKTGPANALALAGVTGGAFLNGAKVFYLGTPGGQFSVANTVTDALSGRASSTTTAFENSSTGWSHVPSTVSALTSGTYVSNSFSWLSGTTSSPSVGVIGADAAGNQTPFSLLFEEDHTSPSGGSVSVAPYGYTKTQKPVVTFAGGTDSQSGIRASSSVLQRANAVDNHDGTCGTFGPFSTVATAPGSPYTEPNDLAEGCYRYQYVITDNVGNITTYGPTSAVMVDTTAPAVSSINLAGTSPSNASTLPFTVTFSERVNTAAVVATSFTVTTANVTGTPTVGTITPTGAVGGFASAYTVNVNTSGTTGANNGTVRLDLTSVGTIQDAATNGLAAGRNGDQSYSYDTIVPTVTNVTSTLADGSYKVGQLVPVQVVFSETVNVTGSPLLTLETGTNDRNATYSSGTGSNTLVFNYTVQSGDTSADLNYVAPTSLTLNNGTIRDAALNNATLTLPDLTAAGSLATNKAIIIDTTAPAVSSINLAGTSPSNASTLPFTVTFSERVNTAAVVATSFTVTTANVTGTPTVGTITPTGAVGGFASAYTVNVNTSGTTGANNGTVRLDLTSVGTIQDAATNGLAAGRNGDQSYSYDTIVPTVTNVTSTLADGSYKVGQLVPVQVVFSETVNVTGSPLLTLETGTNDRNATYSSGTGSNTLVFNYTVQSGDTSADLNYVAPTSLTLNNGTIRDAALNNATLTLPDLTAAGSLATNKAIIVDSTVPTVTNVTSSLAAGSYKLGQVVPVTVTFSESVTIVGTPTLTLETGTTDRSVTFAAGTGTSFTADYTAQTGDTSTDLDYVGTTSLTAGTSIRDAAGNDANRTLAAPGAAGSLGANEAIVIDTTAPINVAITNSPSGRTPTVSGTAGTAAGDVAQVTVNFTCTKTSNGSVSTSSATATVDGSGDWTVTTSNNLLTNAASCYATATQTDAAGNSTTSTATGNWST